MLKQTLAAFAATLALGGAALAETKVPFALDWKFEGPSAPYFAAIDNGHFGAADLDVEISAGQGSLDAIPKVATGAFPVGFAEMVKVVPIPELANLARWRAEISSRPSFSAS